MINYSPENERKILNYDALKSDSESYKQLRSDLKRILKFIPSNDLIKELKKRKIIKKEWNNSKKKSEWREVSKIN